MAGFVVKARHRLHHKTEILSMLSKRTKDEVCLLAFKLKALATHPNTPHNEASLALQKMRALIFKHGISEEELLNKIPTVKFCDRDVFSKIGLLSWERALACVVADFCGCVNLSQNYGYGRKGVRLSFHGTASDVEFAEFLFNCLRKSFMSAGRGAYYTAVDLNQFSSPQSKSRFMRNYCTGCVLGLRRLISDMQPKGGTPDACTALAISKGAAALVYVDTQFGNLKKHTVAPSITDANAALMGIAHGKKSNLSRPLESDSRHPQPSLPHIN
jgi:hypothetical protein